MATTEELMKSYTSSSTPTYQAQTEAINSAYDAAQNKALKSLETAYNESKSALEQSQAEIAPAYQEQRNAVAAQAERDRANYNTYAAANGTNAGTNSQAQLAMNLNKQSNLASLDTAEADANRELQNSLDSLRLQYQSNVANAIAENDYERASALMEEYQKTASSAASAAQADYSNARSDVKEYAEMLAQYGDYSGYKNLGYSDEQIAAMTSAWKYSNPELYAQIYGNGTTKSNSTSSVNTAAIQSASEAALAELKATIKAVTQSNTMKDNCLDGMENGTLTPSGAVAAATAAYQSGAMTESDYNAVVSAAQAAST